MSNQNRFADLLSFLQSNGVPCSSCNPCDCGCECAASLVPLNGDASFRRYYRLKLDKNTYLELLKRHNAQAALPIDEFNGSVIVVDAPPETQKNHEFITINHLLNEAKCLVSTIIVADEKQGFMVLEDLGDALFINKAVKDQQMAYYQKSLMLLLKIALIPQSPEQLAEFHEKKACVKEHDEHTQSDLLPLVDHLSEEAYHTRNHLPPFDADFMRMELGICEEWLFDKTLHLKLTNEECSMLNATWDFLINNLSHQTQVPMHRDFHCRNIMCTPQSADKAINTTLAIIDYQDMVIGPIAYDVASLMYDCYVRLDANTRERLISFIAQRYFEVGLINEEQRDNFALQVKACALQRHIKVLGIFNRLYLRDGKDGYLKDLPLVLDYCLENCDAFEQMKPFKDFLIKYVKDKI